MKNPQDNFKHFGEPEQRSEGCWQEDTFKMKSTKIDFDILEKLDLWINYIISGLLDKEINYKIRISNL